MRWLSQESPPADTRPRERRQQRPLAALSALGVLAALSTAAPVHAQGVIVSGASSSRFVDVRPLRGDSARVENATDLGNGYWRTADGVYVVCRSDGWCPYRRSGSAEQFVALVQDVDMTMWGLGEGVSVHAQLRARTALGNGREVWPQADQRVEALAAYAELERGNARARLGRQWTTSTLGVFNFDGAAAEWRRGTVGLDGYLGRTLVEGLNSAVTSSEIGAVEDLAPTKPSYLFGMSARWRPSGIAGARAEYRREIRTDRAGLYAEHVSLESDARLGLYSVSGTLIRNLVTGQWQEAAARVARPLPAGFSASALVRHYEPFFAAWTIWGAFDPVGYDEQRADLRWDSRERHTWVSAGGGRRNYDRQEAGFTALPLRTRGWRYDVGAGIAAWAGWGADVSYSLDVGGGASRSDGDIGIRRAFGERSALTLRGTAFQTVYEYHVANGTVFGYGGEWDSRITSTTRLVVDAMIYRNRPGDQPLITDWSQRRAGVRLEWTLGGDPGLRPARRVEVQP